jgi:hypothetical protein
MKNFIRASCVLLCTILCLFISKNSYSQQSIISVNGWNAYVHLPASYNSSNASYPTIIFFPGIGEVGTNASAVIANGPGAYINQGWNGNVTVDGKTVEFIVISLQPPYAYPHEDVMNTEIQTIKSLYRVDSKKLYLTGLSHGGWCSSTFVTGDPYGGPYTYASQVAAVVTVEGMIPDDNSPYPQLFDNYAKAGGKYLGFEQIYDNRDTKTVVDRMNLTVPNSGIYVQTNFGGGGHCCWASFYGGQGTAPTNWLLDGVTQNIYQWMARQTLEGTSVAPPNVPPVANAGNNQTITLPVSSVTLMGTGTDSDGSISSYAWSQVSGPSTATINNPATATTLINNLVNGVYTFQLKVTDNVGATATANVSVTVNAAAPANLPPVANAGANQTITLPVSSVTLTGTGTDTDGSISSYAWIQVSGPSTATINTPATATTLINNLVDGVYTFQLKVSDNVGATATANVSVTVNAAAPANLPPVANAGANQTITLPVSFVTLTGTGTDTDGSISSYAWTQVSGPSTATINTPATATTLINNLVDGVYTFQLKVSDNVGATATANVSVTVNAAPVANQAPVANAGTNQIITLPTNSVTLTGSGTDADGTVKSYLWTKISGPNGSSFGNASAATTFVNSLVAGTYIFQLEVTDNLGATGVATTQILVNNQATLPPPTSKNIRVNIYGGSNPYTDPKWNNWNLYAGNTINNMLYEDKTQSSISASISGDIHIADNGSGYASSSTTPPSPVLRYNSYATSYRTLSFSGLDPSKKYTFEMYASRLRGGNDTRFQLNSQEYIVVTGNNASSYAQFTDITPDSDGTVSVILSSVNVWHYIAGFSIIDQSDGASTSKIDIQAVQTDAVSNVQPDATANEKTINKIPEASIYPNPFVSSFQVQIKDEAPGAYRLIFSDIFGKQILVKKVKKGTGPSIENIQVNNLASGNYLLQVINENGSKNVYKIIKQ